MTDFPPLDPQMMREAIHIARQSAVSGGGPFGCVIVRDGRVVGRGHNRVVELHDPTAHGEVVAIRDACRELGTHVLADCDLYSSCEPCPMCLAATWWARVRRIAFACTRADAAAIGFDDQVIYDEVAAPLDRRQLPLVPLLRDEGLLAFGDWTSNPDRVPY